MPRVKFQQVPLAALAANPQATQQFAPTVDWPLGSARIGTFPGKNLISKKLQIDYENEVSIINKFTCMGS